MDNLSSSNPFLQYATNIFASQALPTKPPYFIRVTDNTTFIRFDPEEGFGNAFSTRFVPFSHRLAPNSVKAHLEWTVTPEWGNLISLCGTEEKAEREVAWRRQKQRDAITAYKISTDRLSWRKMEWNPWTTFDVLTDDDGKVVLFRATELIQNMGLQDGLKSVAKWGAKDKWLALEWIQMDMVVQSRRLS